MTEPLRMESPPDRAPTSVFPKWLGYAIVLLLSLQLALGYVQGALLHRQQEELRSIRSDLSDLAEVIEQGQGAMDGGSGQDGVWRPTAPRGSRRSARPPLVLNARMVLDGDEDERARKDLEQSRENARKAVSDAHKVQEQLSVTENARKAEEKKQIDAAQNQWQKWSFIALGLVALALIIRAWIQRRG